LIGGIETTTGSESSPVFPYMIGFISGPVSEATPGSEIAIAVDPWRWGSGTGPFKKDK
jgi:hypothetical protein